MAEPAEQSREEPGTGKENADTDDIPPPAGSSTPSSVRDRGAPPPGILMR
jgi:hypothetical protein